MSNISYKQIIDICHKVKKDDYKLYYYHRLLSLPITKFFYRLNIQANTISISMIILSVVSFVFMIIGIKIAPVLKKINIIIRPEPAMDSNAEFVGSRPTFEMIKE